MGFLGDGGGMTPLSKIWGRKRKVLPSVIVNAGNIKILTAPVDTVGRP